jgi:sulfoxide reductase heme-binding subunit YedZ
LMPFRRHFGITMFLSALLHSGLTVTLLAIVTGQIPVVLQPQLMGVIALSLLFPLWLTSNDLSQQRLGKGWKVLHRLTYLALIFIFLHVAMMMKWIWGVLMGTVLILELLSWLKVWLKKPPQPVVAPVSDSATPSLTPLTSQ